QAAKTLLQIQVSALKSQGKTELTKEEENEMLKIITDRYNSQISPYYAASRLWVDAIIDPLDTRKMISMGIEMADHAPITKQYNVGVIQT
ncbi:MAG: carboxyl transferase domain-containing protein, partial [Bacteroidota bacterium]